MITTTIRIDSRLYEKLVKSANKDKRSINSQINWIIIRYLEMLNWNQKNSIG